MSRTLNFHNQTLRVAVNTNPPFTFLKTTGSGHQSDGGLGFRLMDALAQHFNFRYEIDFCHGVWGRKLPNGTWTGLLGRIKDRKSHFGIGGISLTHGRYETVKFLYPHLVSHVTFISPAPRMGSNVYLGLKPFSYDVWSGFLVSLLGCLLVDRLYRRVCRKSIFLMSIYALLRQQYIDPPEWRQRLWMFFWLFFTFILTTVYAGALVSLITVPIRMKTLDTIQDLLEAAQNNRINVTGLNSAYFDSIMKSSLPAYKELSKYLNVIGSKEEGYSLVASSSGKSSTMGATHHRQYAFISTENSLHYGQMLYGENRVYFAQNNDDGVFFIDLLAIPVADNFLFQQEFNRAITRLREAGIFQHWKDQEYRRLKEPSADRNLSLMSPPEESTETWSKLEAQFDDFTISQLQSFFFIYLFGISFSIVAFLGELVTFKYSSS